MRTQALRGIRICSGERSLGQAIGIEPKNVLGQNDLEHAVWIGWVFGTISATGSSAQHETRLVAIGGVARWLGCGCLARAEGHCDL